MSAAAVGYSGTPLPRKLGFKPGQKAAFIGLPPELEWLVQSEDFGSVESVGAADLGSPFPIEGEGLARAGGSAEIAGQSTGGTRRPKPNAVPLARGALDLIHAFYTDAARLKADLPLLRAAIQPAGMIWISWPKRTAKVATDITEDVIRAEALDIGLVDVKVCAVTEVWSGLKLVIPVAQRTPGRTGR